MPPAHGPPDIIAIVASSGGIEATSIVLAGLPANLPAAAIVLLHVGAYPSNLPWIFGRVSPLPVRFAEDDLELQPRHVYVAPPDRHLTIDAQAKLRLTSGPKINFARPAADPLLVSLALNAPKRTVGVVLSGANADGAMGAWAIRRAGGIVIAQDPQTAPYPTMPQTAVAFDAADFVLPPAHIAVAIETLTMRPTIAASQLAE